MLTSSRSKLIFFLLLIFSSDIYSLNGNPVDVSNDKPFMVIDFPGGATIITSVTFYGTSNPLGFGKTAEW